jgi:heat shock protein HslJ
MLFEFDGSQNTYFGHLGCNMVSGRFTLTRSNGIRLNQGIGTMLTCPSMEVEIDMRKALKGI